MIQPTDIAINYRFKDVVITKDNIEIYVNQPYLLEPIPLTLDMLIEFGCKQSGNFKNTVILGLLSTITEQLGVFTLTRNGSDIAQFNYVHEFQKVLAANLRF